MKKGEVETYIKEKEAAANTRVIKLKTLPTPKNQIGPTCGYYAMSLALDYWNLTEWTPFYPARRADSHPPASRSLRGIGKHVMSDFGVGQILDVKLFENVLQKVNYQCSSYEFETEADLIYLIRTMLENGFPVIIPVDYSEDKVVLDKGAHPHFVTIVSLIQNPDQSYDCVIASHGEYHIASLSSLYSSSTNLEECPHRLYEKRKNKETQKTYWYPISLDKKADSKAKLYELPLSPLAGLKGKLSLVYPPSLTREHQSMHLDLQTRLEISRVIRKKILNKEDLNEIDNVGQTALDYLAEPSMRDLAFYLFKDLRNQNYIKQLISHKNFDVNAFSYKNESWIHLAVLNNDMELIEALLDAGADINLKNSQGNTPLNVALMRANIDIARLLVKRGARDDIANLNGHMALHIAVYYFTKEVVELFLKKENLVQVDGQGNTPLLIAISRRADDEVIDMLINDESINIPNANGDLPLYTALDASLKKEMLMRLLDKNNIHHKDQYGDIPLHIAIRGNHEIEIIELLIDENNINEGDYEGRSALYNAINYNCSPEIIVLLISSGADIHKKNRCGKSPLDLACELNEPLLVAMLTDERNSSKRKAKNARDFWYFFDKKSTEPDSFLLFKRNKHTEQYHIPLTSHPLNCK